MHLKNCCALLLLAFVACKAAPSISTKTIEKKSIGEEARKISKDEIKLEDTGADKDRAKKSATTFCVEVHSGVKQQVPCKEEVPQPAQMSLIPYRRVLPFKEVPPAAPAPQTVQVIQTLPTAPASQPVHLIQAQPSAPAPQPVQLVQTQPTAPAQQSVQVVQTQAPAQPVQVIQPQPIAPQTVQFFQPQQPAPVKIEHVQQPQEVQTIHVQSVPQPQTQIVLPAAPQPAPEPVNLYLPAPQQTEFVLPAAQVAPPQPVALNILPVPTATGCSQSTTYNIQAPQPVVQPEVKPEPVEEKPVYKPKLEPEPAPLPVSEVELVSVEPVPCKQEMVVLPPRPVMLIEEQRPLQLASATNYCGQPHHLADCTCHKSKGSHGPLARHHTKVHEHHLMVYPTSGVAPARFGLQNSYPLNLISPSGHNPAFVFSGTGQTQPRTEYGDTVITIHTEPAHQYYPITYSHDPIGFAYPTTYSNDPTTFGYPPTYSYDPTKFSDAIYPYSSYSPKSPTVTVNAYPPSPGPLYRESQPTTQQDSQNPSSSNKVAHASTEPSNQQ